MNGLFEEALSASWRIMVGKVEMKVEKGGNLDLRRVGSVQSGGASGGVSGAVARVLRRPV